MGTVQTITVTNAGGTVTLDPLLMPDTIYLEMDGGSVTLSNDFTIDSSSVPPVGSRFNVLVGSGLDLNGHAFSIFGQNYTANQQASNTLWWYMFQVFDGPLVWFFVAPYDFASSVFLSGQALVAGTTALTKLESGTSAQMIVCNAGGVPTYVAISGDITISNAGVVAIAAGAIVNADINASAAIARSKLGTGTVDHVVINDSSGNFSSEAQLANSRGGTGQDTSASTGFPTVNAGTWSVGTLTDVRHLDNISFVTANQGTYYIYFPFACTVTNINVRVTSAVSGTDNGELTIANNSGTVMAGSSLTAGVLTVAASAAFGTGYSSTLTSNNTFTAGQSMRITSAKVTTGGVVSADITYTRTS